MVVGDGAVARDASAASAAPGAMTAVVSASISINININISISAPASVGTNGAAMHGGAPDQETRSDRRNCRVHADLPGSSGMTDPGF